MPYDPGMAGMQAVCVAARSGDHSTILRLMREYYAHDRIRFDRGVQGRALSRLLHDRALGCAFLIRRGRRTAGYAVLTFDFGLEEGGREVFVDELFIRERHRGLGLGRMALAFIEGWCRARGVRAVHLAVERANRRALAFYLKAGFRLQRRHLLTRRVVPPRARAIVGRLRRSP